MVACFELRILSFETNLILKVYFMGVRKMENEEIMKTSTEIEANDDLVETTDIVNDSELSTIDAPIEESTEPAFESNDVITTPTKKSILKKWWFFDNKRHKTSFIIDNICHYLL